MSGPRYSVIMPAYNSVRFIDETILSVINQTFTDWELLIYDDGSTDGSVTAIEEYVSKDPRVKLTKGGQNSGAAAARNKLISDARGEYIAFLDSDDLWLPTKLSEHENVMRNSDVNISFSCYEIMDEQGNRSGKAIDVEAPLRVSYLDMLKKNATMGCLTVVVRRSAFKDLSMPLIRQGQDYALWLKLLKETDYAWRIEKVLAVYRIVGGSISRNKVRKAYRQWQIYREIESLSLMHSFYYFSSYVCRALYRR